MTPVMRKLSVLNLSSSHGVRTRKSNAESNQQQLESVKRNLSLDLGPSNRDDVRLDPVDDADEVQEENKETNDRCKLPMKDQMALDMAKLWMRRTK